MTATARDVRVRPPIDLTRGYLHQVDIVRLLTFGSVIMVHTMASTTAPDDAVARGVLMLLHFTRGRSSSSPASCSSTATTGATSSSAGSGAGGSC